MYVEIADDIYNNFDDELKGKLKPYEPENTDALKSKANEILGEKKAIEAELLRAKADLKEAKSSSGNKNLDELQSKLDDAINQLGDWKGKYETLETETVNSKLIGEASRIAAGLTKDTGRAALLSKEIRGRLSIDSDGFSVLDESGKPTISTVEELTGQIKTKYPFLVDGSQASGGGAQGNSGGAAGTSRSETATQLSAKVPGFNELPVK